MKNPQINIELSIRPRNIHVSSGNYEVNLFLDEELAITLPVCYNSYMDAEVAVRQYILERLKGE